MERTTVDGCSFVDESSDLGGNAFSLEELVIGTQTDNQTLTSFDPSGKEEGTTPLKSGCTGIVFFFWEMHGPACPACFL